MLRLRSRKKLLLWAGVLLHARSVRSWVHYFIVVRLKAFISDLSDVELLVEFILLLSAESTSQELNQFK